jgi:ABC-type antimicrobial peptide transport system permease subunit
VGPFDPAALASAVFGVLAIATLAMWIPARRAAAMNPADTLRAE